MKRDPLENKGRYWKKNHIVTEEEYELMEVQCPSEYCKKIFAIDYRWTDGLPDDSGIDQKYYSKYYCPYCGRKIIIHI